MSTETTNHEREAAPAAVVTEVQVRATRPPTPPTPEVIDVVVPHTLYARFVKRTLDIVLSALVLVVLLPLLLVIALAVRHSLGKGVLYPQERVGRDGRTFSMLKFRTMGEDRRRADLPYQGVDRRVSHKRDDDPRHTRFGRVLRRHSLDELPQFVNVLKGEMSIVGPRPELASVVNRLQAGGHARHLVRPGITGLWQVTQRQEGRPLADDFDDDLVYVSRLSFWLDLSIVARTFRVVLAGSGR